MKQDMERRMVEEIERQRMAEIKAKKEMENARNQMSMAFGFVCLR